MGNGAGQGIYARKASILIYFQYGGDSCLERLALEPTPKNLVYAQTMRKEILRRIEIGTFKFEDFFPNSPRVAKTSSQTFGAVKRDWLASKAKKISPTTHSEYRKNLSYFDELDADLISTISFQRLDRLMSGLEVSGKTFNNILSCLRQIFEYAIKCELIKENQAALIETAPKKQPEPDPFTAEEMRLIIADMFEHYPLQVASYFALAFAIGFRPSEGIALQWAKIDWRMATLTIDSARVRSIDKGTKTGKIRHVELDDYALSLLAGLKPSSYMKEDGYIFLNPATDERWKNTDDPMQKYWKPCLKRLKIRGRDARQTRHTCATIMLMEGCRPAWAAEQLGHSIEMFFKVYAKWIKGQDEGRERQKMAGVFTTDARVKTFVKR